MDSKKRKSKNTAAADADNGGFRGRNKAVKVRIIGPNSSTSEVEDVVICMHEEFEDLVIVDLEEACGSDPHDEDWVLVTSAEKKEKEVPAQEKCEHERCRHNQMFEKSTENTTFNSENGEEFNHKNMARVQSVKHEWELLTNHIASLRKEVTVEDVLLGAIHNEEGNKKIFERVAELRQTSCKLQCKIQELEGEALKQEDPQSINERKQLRELFHETLKVDRLDKLYKTLVRARNSSRTKNKFELAIEYTKPKKFDSAISLFEECIETWSDANGCKNQATLAAKHYLGMLFLKLARLNEAQELLRECSDAYEETLGPYHNNTIVAMNNLASVYVAKGEHMNDAEVLLEECLELRMATLGSQHRDTLASMMNLAMLYAKRGKNKWAERYYKECLETRRKVFGPRHPDTLRAFANLIQFRKNIKTTC